jgi:hypothetical protein
VYLADTLTREVDGYCVTSLVNTLREDVIIGPPHVEIEAVEGDCHDAAFRISNSVVEDSSRLSKLPDELRTDNLNSEERVPLIKI